MKRPLWSATKEYQAVKLDDKGRCCGRKLLVYKRPVFHHFCCRCDRSFNREGLQIDNWAWEKTATGEFRRMSGII